MSIYSDERHYATRSPGHVAISKWMDGKYNAIDKLSTQAEKELARYRFSPIASSEIWVEDARPTTELEGKCLVSYAIRKRGYAVLDAIVNIVTLADLISFYNVPVKTFNTYAELIAFIKQNKRFMLYKVNSSPSNKYGLLDDTSLSDSERYNRFIEAFSNISMDITVSYEDRVASLTDPVVGSIAFTHGSLKTFTAELYHYQDLIKT